MSVTNQKQLDHRVLRTVHGCRMFKGGDRVAAGVSGGKDSSLMLLTLARLRDRIKGGFELKAFRVFDPESPCHSDSESGVFTNWCSGLDVNLEWIHLLPGKPGDSVNGCFRCAWRRRESLFKTIHACGFPVLALGHSAFDVAVTALMNLFLHGNLESMPPSLSMFSGKISIIRPLCNIKESEILQLHRKNNLPEPPPSCDEKIGRTRAYMEQLVRDLIQFRPQILENIVNAAPRWKDPPNRDYQDDQPLL